MSLVSSLTKTANVRLKCGKRKRIDTPKFKFELLFIFDSFTLGSPGILALEGERELWVTHLFGVPMKPWKTCLASVPDEVDPEIAKYAATMVTCASIFICLTDKDAATNMTEFLCPLCGALVRRYSKPIGLYAETETPDYYNPIFGHCPLGKSVHLILVNCPACSAGFKE